MQTLLDILASGVHDTKNQLFLAESLLSAAESAHGIDLGDARYAIESASARLNRTLAAYRLLREGAGLAIVPTVIADLIEEIALEQKSHLNKLGISLEIDCPVVDEWALDRDLVADMLNNAVQNAARFASQRIRLSARIEDNSLVLSVDDDGPGFTPLPPTTGVGLQLAARLAELHVRRDRHGSLSLSNDGPLGGARFVLRLP